MQRAELVLARARTFLAICALIAIYVDPTEPGRYATLAYTLLTIYVIYSIAVLVMLRRFEVSGRSARIFHGFDVLWVAVITLFTSGPNSPFFMFFVFVLMAAAYRWGFRRTMLTAGLCMGLMILEVLALQPRFVQGEFELNRLIIRLGYLFIVGLLVGYLAEEQLEHGREIQSTVRILTKLQNQTSLRSSLELVIKELTEIFKAREVMFAVKEKPNSRVYLWSSAGVRELDTREGDTYLFPADDNLLLVSGRDRAKIPGAFHSAHHFQRMLACTNHYEDWMGRIFVLEPTALSKNGSFFYSLIRQITPTIYSAYLLHRLRSRAGALARARVAAELHDGVVQALIGFEMQIQALRSKANGKTAVDGEDLARIQDGLHGEVLNLRDLMQQLKPVDLDQRRLVEFVAELVDRFRRDTGITAKFVCEMEEVALPSYICRDVVRLIREALINVRKHSGAHNVVVDLSRRNGSLRLAIVDDGQGFGFTGRVTDKQFDLKRRPPAVIQECVRSIGGSFSIESSESGACVEVMIPESRNG
jgi:signal transduction histidine kinase